MVLGPGQTLDKVAAYSQRNSTGRTASDAAACPIGVGLARNLRLVALPLILLNGAPATDQVPA